MWLTKAAVVVIVLGMVLAGAMASASSGGAEVFRQRIAIEEVFDFDGTGTFTITPLTPGPIKADKGTLRGSGACPGTAMRDGMKVSVCSGSDTLSGRYGTLRIAQQWDDVLVHSGAVFKHQVGTWKVATGTGKYFGFKGGGRFVGVIISASRELIHEEGWVTG